MYKLMLIEDDYHLSKLICEYLERYDYEVYTPTNFMNIIEEFNEIKPDLVLLDINLPYFDGFYVSRTIRKHSNVPIIIISARNQDVDQILAIELGADDYITKPFTFELLQSKIKATIRRIYGEYSSSITNETRIGKLCIDADTLNLTYKNEIIELSKNEYKLLKKLMEHYGKFVAREELIEEVWDSVSFVDDNTLTVNISRIKQMLNKIGLKDAIKNKRGVGYMLYSPTLMEIDS